MLGQILVPVFSGNTNIRCRAKAGTMEMDQWSIVSDAVKCVQYNQHPLCHYQLEVKAPEQRHCTKMYKD